MIDLTDKPLISDPLGWGMAEREGGKISAQDKALLLAELEAAGLADATPAEQQDYLNNPKFYDNGPAPMVQVEAVDYAALQRWVGGTLSRVLGVAPQFASKWGILTAAFLSAQPQADPVNSNSERLAGIAALLKADGIDPQVGSLFSTPDPNHIASEWHTPANHILGRRVIVQTDDLA